MLAIRLRRAGSKKRPFFRVVVADSRAARDSSFVEIVGHYNPRRDPIELVLDEEKIKKWLGTGAQPSDTVARLLADKGLYEKSKVRVRKARAKRDKKA